MVKIRVLLVDDDALVRAGLRMILSSSEELEVVGEAADGADAVATAQAHRPDVVLMDIRMPGMDGIAATSALRQLATPPTWPRSRLTSPTPSADSGTGPSTSPRPTARPPPGWT